MSGGILDSTRYIDENRYANDEDSQFMISAFNVGEAYLKFQLLKSVDFTIDLQYQKDHTVIAGGDPQAWFLGSRLNLEF